MDRMPDVQLASARLQEMMGLRSNYKFELPLTPPATPPKDLVAKKIISTTKQSAVKNQIGLKRRRELKRQAELNTSGETTHLHTDLNSTRSRDRTSSTSSSSPLGLDSAVNRETGRGLFEYLMNMGKTFGMKKLQCTHISFHVLKEYMEIENDEQLDIVYTREEGYKIEAYEIELPKEHKNAEIGFTSIALSPWVSFMVTAPAIILDYDFSCLPRRFPKRLPESWVVFALPLSSCIKYDVVTDKYPTDFDTTVSSPCALSSTSLSESKSNVHKCIDFDVAGAPFFEFSGKPIGTLKGWDIWCMNSGELDFDVDAKDQTWTAGDLGQFLSVNADNESQLVNKRDEDGWYDFYFGCIHADVMNWKIFRELMSQGKQRIVARWDEPAALYPTSGASSEQPATMWEEELTLFVNDDPRIGDGLGLFPSSTLWANEQGTHGPDSGMEQESPSSGPAKSPWKLRACRKSKVEKWTAYKGGKRNTAAKKSVSVNAWLNRR